MSIINCEINLILALPKNCNISSATTKTKFAITDTKLYVPVVTLLTEDNVKLLKQLESDFKRTINRNIYQSKVTQQAQNRFLNYLIDPTANRVFALSVENKLIKKYRQVTIFQK